MSDAELTLLLTRPKQQAGEWLARMAALGVQALSLPLIEIVPTDGQAAKAAWDLLPTAALALFVSPNAVSNFFACQAAGQVWPEQTLAACVGPGSARALVQAGVPAALIVQPPADSASLDSEHLWPLLRERIWAGRRVLMLRGDGGREWLADRLREQGALPEFFSVYQRRCPSLMPNEQGLLNEALAAPERFVWLFSSAEAIGYLQTLAGLGHDWRHARCIATHERIAARAVELGVGHVVLARPDARAVAEALGVMRGRPLQSFSL
ncbi:uroporphyrinogen-III synthase [Paucibacter sp. B2R-40]|uniref:uroporphyrinogen-III synthase n=1 Tax=Paucibacter sp. B2R-40 TaxID=2893554 RepID=UPI0021E42DF1|nr:uroporphyrinogen-III synthase [Paucibacter sp. B2R-40]MCV2354852.1 uroporphyrinogen-III synthase [Paucibacter sp. B2R-40]